MRLITTEDFRDIYIKFHQRGLPFLLSKLNFNSYSRTQSAFNDKNLENANFWMIPKVRERWNILITGNKNTSYEEYLSEKYFLGKKIKMLSLGSGVCSHELLLARLNPSWNIDCFDFSDELLETARKNASEKKLENISFFAENILTYPFGKEKYDVVFFHASLHHFDDIFNFLKNTVIHCMKPGGYLIINEYAGKNRLQYHKEQIEYINKAIRIIPKKYRRIFKTNIYKNNYTGSGILRMIVADPSECADSENILPAIHQYFDVVEEKPYGNNLLQNALKDISHHFADENLSEDKIQALDAVFALEDKFLEKHPSDYIFGVYHLKN